MQRTLLVLDYPGRRAEGRISDLGFTEYGYEVVDLLERRLPDEVTGRNYTKALVDWNALGDRDIVGVLGYCAAAPLAQELAQHLVDAGYRAVPVFLFNATARCARNVRADYNEILTQLGVLPSPDTPGAIDVEGLLSSPRELLNVMHAELSGIIKKSLEDDLFDEDEVTESTEEIVAVYLDLMRYQISAYNSTAPEWGGEVVNLVSTCHSDKEDWAGANRIHHVQIDCRPSDLLTCAHTRERVLGFLEWQSRQTKGC